MVVIGFTMLLSNAAGYVFQWEDGPPFSAALGCIFTAIGAKIARKA